MNKLRLQYLLSKLKAGKKEYFDEFYRLTKGAVWYVVGKYLKDEFGAEDVMQDAYISFLNNLERVKDDPLPYLCGIAKNKALDVLKKDVRIDKSLQPEDLQLSVCDDYEFDAPLLQTCKKKLSKEEYFILEHTVILGYTRVAVAEMIDKPVSTVNRNYNKMLVKIKEIAKEVYR